jgi:hypothetical protein
VLKWHEKRLPDIAMTLHVLAPEDANVFWCEGLYTAEHLVPDFATIQAEILESDKGRLCGPDPHRRVRLRDSDGDMFDVSMPTPTQALKANLLALYGEG